MNLPTYPEFVASLAKPGDVILSQLTAHDCDLLHMGLALCGEAGELADAIKKPTIYRKPIDLENVKEELGDIEFYLEHIRQLTGITREEVIAANMEKLLKRYEQGYSDRAAQERKDKA